MQKTTKTARPVTPQRPPHARPSAPGRSRMRLPFEKRPTDISSWAYEHRVGLLCMVIAYLAFGIAFVSTKIVLNKQVVYNTIYVDLAQIEPEPPQEEKLQQERDKQEDYSDVKNRVSDANGRDQSVGQISPATAPSKSTSEFMENLDEQAEEVAGRVRASREAFEKGRREEQEMIDRNKAQREAKPDETASGVKQKGRVLVTYWLPGRRDVSLVVPAYQCEGGGEVVVNITVNRNGHVVSASLKESSTSSTCITDCAVMASRNSRFNVDGKVSDRMNGTITYVFIPQ